MTAEEWLREHGIEVERPAPPSGTVAKHPTAALPEDAAPAIDEHETRRVPSVVRLDIHIGGDLAEWPTVALPGVHALVPAHAPPDGDAPADLGTPEDAPPDVMDAATAPLPVVPPVEDVTHLPTRRLGSAGA